MVVVETYHKCDLKFSTQHGCHLHVALCAQSTRWFLGRHVEEITNVTIGSICWLALAGALVIYVHRLVVANRTGKRW